EQRVVRQRGGVDLNYRGEGLRASVGLDVQDERLAYAQAGPRAFEVERSFLSLLPSARLRLDLSERRHLDLSYRASTRTPGVTQLRDVVDDRNPLLVTTGNPDLRPSATHGLSLRYRAARPEAGT